MRRRLRLVAVFIGGIALAAAPPRPAGAADPVKIGFNIWVGFGPLYIARDKGSAISEKSITCGAPTRVSHVWA